MEDLIYVDSHAAMNAALNDWEGENVLGIDTECENNLHYFGTFISIIQVSSKDKNWIIDVLKLQQIEPVLSMLEDPGIVKIFHDASFDLMILYHQFRCRPQNIFDTQVAAQFLGKKELGLGALLAEYFGAKKENHFQMIDWTRRPLSRDMLSYAVGDTKYLLRLRDILSEELKNKDRVHWVDEEFKVIEEKGLAYEEKGYMEFPGNAFFTDRQRSVLKNLFDLRKEMAKTANKPAYYIISTKRMNELVKNPLVSLDEWRNACGVHPIVRKNARLFHDAVQEGLKCEIKRPPVHRIHYTPMQSEHMKKLSEMREKAAAELGIPKHLLMSKEQMHEIAMTGHVSCLRNWQKELFSVDQTD
ncbi:MAG: HRDC domain-containing protein [Candidatus Altiarchaeia archaeon]